MSPTPPAKCERCSKEWKSKRTLTQHKKTCKVIPPVSDTDLAMLDFTDDDFNDTDLSSTNCNSDECKETKYRLKKKPTPANKRAAEHILHRN